MLLGGSWGGLILVRGDGATVGTIQWYNGTNMWYKGTVQWYEGTVHWYSWCQSVPQTNPCITAPMLSNTPKMDAVWWDHSAATSPVQ